MIQSNFHLLKTVGIGRNDCYLLLINYYIEYTRI